MFDHADENKGEVAGVTEAAAYVLGRNMFGPGHGEWDLAWKRWWGEEPPSTHRSSWSLTTSASHCR